MRKTRSAEELKFMWRAQKNLPTGKKKPLKGYPELLITIQ